MMQDLFGEQRIKVEGNSVLETTANHILRLVTENPGLLTDKKIKYIDHNLRMAVWKDNGLSAVLGDKLNDFEEWAKDNNRCIDPEVIRRARQYLVEHDYIRLPAEAVRDAERKRQFVSSSFGRR